MADKKSNYQEDVSEAFILDIEKEILNQIETVRTYRLNKDGRVVDGEETVGNRFDSSGIVR